MMKYDRSILDRARLARDARFDGLFFTGVKSTGIFCRPICPAPPPKPENIVYYPTAAAAAAAGLRPCLRCRPEAAPGTPAWNGTSATVARAMHLIRQGALENGSVPDLADRLGIGPRHLRRLFQKHLGSPPKAIADHQRLLFARKLVMETDLPITQAALAAGYGSLPRFNAAFRKIAGQTPTELRKGKGRPRFDKKPQMGFHCTLKLAYRPPYDWERMLTFFRRRAIARVERVENASFSRTIRLSTTHGIIIVRHAPNDHALELEVDLNDSRELMAVVERVRRMFDLDANPQAIHRTLGQDSRLARLIRKAPGLRLPGAWDPFETAVRAVVGQQISVKGAVTLLGRIASLAGPQVGSGGQPHLTRFFPSAAELAEADLSTLGMPRRRKATLGDLSRQVATGAVTLDGGGDLQSFVSAMTALPGIGDWTANYIAMRGLGEPDAFPASDLGICEALRDGARRLSARQATRRAETWRPWRAYAAIYLWMGGGLE